MLLGFTRLALATDLQAKLDQYTCPLDGFVHAHVDEFDPLLVYLEPTCPADAVETAMAPVITELVTTNYNQTDTVSNPNERVDMLIQNVRVDMANWLNTHTRDDIAAFLNDEKRMRGKIVNELISQGILA